MARPATSGRPNDDRRGEETHARRDLRHGGSPSSTRFSRRRLTSERITQVPNRRGDPEAGQAGNGAEDGGQARGSGNSSARSGRARMAAAGGLNVLSNRADRDTTGRKRRSADLNGSSLKGNSCRDATWRTEDTSLCNLRQGRPPNLFGKTWRDRVTELALTRSLMM
jgi:hypothetical protein